MAKSAAVPPGESILTVQIAQEMDFLLARQRAKQIAALIGFDLQDQTRIATAVSEIARNAFEYGNGGRVEYVLEAASHAGETGTLRILVSDRGTGIAGLDAIWAGTYTSTTGMGLGLTGARRLMDALDVQTGAGGTVVSMGKRLPRGAEPPPVATIVQELIRNPARQSLAAQQQDQELLRLLGELRTREAELRAVNQELEETNRGVLVLYAELEDKARAVQQASEMKTRFLSSVTHELRTPLNSIVSLSRLMLSHTDGPLNPEQEKQAQFILRSANNLTEMVSDLLDMARVEAGKATIERSEFTVADLLAGLRGMFRPLAIDPAVKLVFEIPDEPLRLETDEAKLAQILRNFISNALKFTQAGTITVSARPEPNPDASGHGLITFAVTDTGVGIAPEHHELIMQEWGQAPGALQGRQKGSGLGLPLSRSFAELLGGEIGFTSAPGTGSSFRVTLPALVVPSVAPVAPEPEPAQILIVDDDEVSRYLLRRRLAGYTTAEIVEATGGEAALAAIERRRPQLVFLDVIMPGMGGFEVARRLRQNERTADLEANLAVVLHSSKTLSDDERRLATEYDLTVIPKRGDGDDEDRAEQGVQLERALLQVGLANVHEAPAPAAAMTGRLP